MRALSGAPLKVAMIVVAASSLVGCSRYNNLKALKFFKNANKAYQAQDYREAAKLYQEYNAGLMDFLVNTGAITAKKAAELKAISYVPFYRINDNGEVQLMIDKEHPVRIANTKDQPQLKELIGGNTSIMPVFTSSAQNTFMITGMGLRNQAVKETSFMLHKLGIASRVAPGQGPKGDNVVRFFKKGQPYYAVIDTDALEGPVLVVFVANAGRRDPARPVDVDDLAGAVPALGVLRHDEEAAPLGEVDLEVPGRGAALHLVDMHDVETVVATRVVPGPPDRAPPRGARATARRATSGPWGAGG